MKGYDGTSLRQIAEGAGIQEPRHYNHFAGKQALSQHMEKASSLREYTDLPAIITDL